MAQQIIDVGANANDGTGEPLREAFTAVNDNFTQIWTAGPVGSQVKISGNIVTTTVTNLGLTLAGNGIGNIQANSTVIPGTSGVYNLGAPDRTFQYIYGDYLVGNGALITGIVANTSYNNANVAAFLPTYTGNLVSLTGPVITTANVVAGNIITGGFLGVTGNITSVANITGNNLISTGRVSAVGNITTTANVAGNYFIGNGAFLTGITASNISANALTGTTLSSNVIYSSLQVVDDLLYLDVVGNVTTQGLFIGSGAGLTNVPGANVTGQVANALVAGTVYTNAQPNITSVGTLTSLTATGNIAGNYFIGNGALLTGISTSGVNANALVGDVLSSNVLYSSLKVVDDLLYLDVVGNVTTQGRFIGSGAGLTSIPGANITGTVANAAYATIAGTAYSVAGANVTGTVANATYSDNAGIATFANTATVATYANTANAVAGANVIGAVANAAYATAAGTATTATTATTAGTVTTAAQPNITSVGILTSVSVSGNATAGNILTSGKISAVGNVTGNYFIGNGALLTGVAATNVNANALVGDVLSSNVLYSSLKVVDDLLYLDVVGNITTTGQFIGSGAGLTNIPGANITGTVPSATGAVTAGTVTAAAQPNITSVGVLTSVSSTGNVTGNYFIGNGSQLTGINAASVSANALTGSTLSANVLNSTLVSVGNLNNLSVVGNAIGGNLLTAGVVSATGNVTTANYFVGNGRQLTGIQASEVGVLANLSVTGNTQTGNLLTGGTVSAVGNIRTTGNITGNYFIGNGSQLTGIIASAGAAITNGNSNVTVNANGNVTVGVVGTSNVAVFANTGIYVDGVLSATGNVAGNYLLGNGALITGLPAGYSNADVANYLPTYSGNLVSLTGPVTTTGNITAGNVITGGLISATGNVTGNYILGNGALLTGVITSVANINNGTSNVTVVSSGGNVTVGVDGTSNVAVFATTGEYITGLLSASGNITGGNILTGGLISSTGTITGSSLLGTVASLSGNVTGGNVLTGGLISSTSTITSAANITGGNLLTGGEVSAVGNISGNYFIGNGSQLTGVAASSVYANALIGNTLSSNVLYSSLTQVGTLANLSVTANVTGGNVLTGGIVSATANVIGGNIFTGGIVTATGEIISTANITGANLVTAGLATVSGNITGGNLLTGGVVSATANITGGNVLTAGLISATSTITSAANITGGNVLTGGLISATGNVIGGNVNTSNIQPVSGALTIATASGNLNLLPAGNVVLANTIITGVAYPQQDTDAASKLYVDNFATTAITYHEQVLAATTTDLATTTGGTITYTQPNGVSNGIGAYLSTTGSFNLVDTANIQTVGTRVLVKNEANAVYNGVYTWSNATVIVRSTDADQYGSSSTEAFSINDYFFVQSGNINRGAAYVVSAPAGTITFGTSNITFSEFSSSQTYTANTNAGISLVGTVFNAKVDNDTTAFDGAGNIMVKPGANLTTPNIGAATGTSISLTGNVTGGNVNTGGLVSATGNVTGNYFLGNGTQLTGILGSNVNMGSNTAGTLVSNAVTLTTTTTVTNGIALLNQVLGKLVPPAPPSFPGGNTITLSGITTYRMANITQVDNTPGANKAVAAGTSVANVLRVATYATNTVANVGPGDAGTITAVRNGSNVGNVTLNTGASPSGNGTYGSNLVISNNFDYNSANANITAGFWYVFSARVSGASAPPGWNEVYIADSSTGNTNTTVWYYDNSSPSTPAFSSTTMTPPGSANVLYSSTIPHYTNNNNFTIAFTVANISGNTYPTSNTLASGSSGGAFAAPSTINYNGSNIGSNVLNSFASATANTTASITTGFGGSSTGPSMSVNNSYATGTLTLTTALANTVLYKSGSAVAVDEANVVIGSTIGTGSGNAYRIANPGSGNTPAYSGSEAAFDSQNGPLQTYDAVVVGSGSQGILKHDQTNYATGYLPAGPNLSASRSGTQYFTFKFVRTAVSKFDIRYTGNVAGMWVALPGSVIDSSSSANGWINMAVAYGGAGYPGVNAPGNGSDGCAVGGIVSLNTSVSNSSKTCTFGTVSSSSTATNEIYVRIALSSGQSVTALTLQTASN
jgi:hypothetical protein